VKLIVQRLHRAVDVVEFVLVYVSKSSDWNFDVGESSSYRIQTSVRLHTEQVLNLLQAMLAECQVNDAACFLS